MLSIIHRPQRAILAGILVLSSGGVFAATASPETGPASCEIQASAAGGATQLTALADAEDGVSGTYSFKVKGSGTNISQGGPFKVSPGRPVMLGTVTLGGSGAAYKATLDVTVDGETVSCRRRIG